MFDADFKYMLRAAPFGGRTMIDLDKPSDTVTFRHLGCSEGTIQISALTGASGTWRLTVERSSDGSNFVEMPSATVYQAGGVQASFSITTEYTRVRVTTPQGAEATAVVSMYARA